MTKYFTRVPYKSCNSCDGFHNICTKEIMPCRSRNYRIDVDDMTQLKFATEKEIMRYRFKQAKAKYLFDKWS